MKKKNCNIDVFDPWVNNRDLQKKITFKLIRKLKNKKYDAIILAVAHSIFKKIGFEKINSLKKRNGFFYDVKSLFYGNNVECL